MIKEEEFKEIQRKAHKSGTLLRAIQKKSKKTVRLGVRVGIIELALIEKLANSLGISKSRLVRISIGEFAETLDGMSQKEIAKVIIAIKKYE